MKRQHVSTVARDRKLRAADQALRKDADVQSLLYHYTDGLYRADNLDAIYEAALVAICEGLHSDRAAILRFDERGVMRFVAWRGLSERYRTAADGHSPWSMGQRDADIICVPDVTRDPGLETLEAALAAEHIRGLCFIPLAPDDRVIGKFMVYFSEPRALVESERKLALIIARQLGFALQSHLADSATRRLAALVEGSDDAIVSKTLDGIITSWNEGAERLFGYTADEAIGQPITMLIPPDRLSEELQILTNIRHGQRMRSYETVRRHRDGHLVDVSLTISPVRDSRGVITGASKIARDISARRRAADAQLLLLQEMNHRVKNAYAVASSLINLSVSSAQTPRDLAIAVSDRLAALAQAHSLAAAPLPGQGAGHGGSTLREMLCALLAPFSGETEAGASRISIRGDDIAINEATATPLALLFHELATNAAKYGSLTSGKGRVEITVTAEPEQSCVTWQEIGGPAVKAPDVEGFGSTLVRIAARQVGDITRHWNSQGVSAKIIIKKRPDASDCAENRARAHDA